MHCRARTLLAAGLLLLLTTVDFTLGECPTGYTASSNQKCYKVLNKEVSKDVNKATAKSQCEADQGGFLPLITSNEDNKAVHDVWKGISSDVRTSEDAAPWIGMTCTTSNAAECKWDVESEQSTFRNFDQNQPNIGSTQTPRSCVTFSLSADKWYSSLCSQQRLVICEAKVSQTCKSPFSLQNGKCLWVSEKNSTFSVARSECEKNSAVLLSVHSKQENDQLGNSAKGKLSTAVKSIWLGAALDTNLNSNQFQWLDGSPMDYSNFKAPFPSMRYGDCLKLVINGDEAGSWQNGDCDAALPFVCLPRVASSSPAGSCPQNKYFADTGEIQSPGYPEFYGAVNCDYHINVDLNKFVRITFQDFSLAEGDSLALFEGEESVEPIQSLQEESGVGKTFTTTKSNLLRLRFTTKASTTNKANTKGWKLKHEPVGNRPSHRGGSKGGDPQVAWPDTGPLRPTKADQCPQGNYSTEMGKLVSPGFGLSPSAMNYANNLNCTYTITLQDNQRVELRFTELDIEGCCDFVDVFDGPTIQGEPLATLSGTLREGQSSIRSSSNQLTIRFTSDSLVNAPGWLAEYRPLPNES